MYKLARSLWWFVAIIQVCMPLISFIGWYKSFWEWYLCLVLTATWIYFTNYLEHVRNYKKYLARDIIAFKLKIGS